MSDEPKQHSAARIGSTVLALLVLYPLSIGPATLITNSPHMSSRARTAVATVYLPVFRVCDHFKLAADAITSYVDFWDSLIP
jgi:hypothetical protein